MAEITASKIVRVEGVDYTALDKALSEVKNGLTSKDQYAINVMAENINNAILVLENTSADYSALDSAIKTANAITRVEGENYDALDAAIKGANDAKTAQYGLIDQNKVNEATEALNAAIKALKPSTTPETQGK